MPLTGDIGANIRELRSVNAKRHRPEKQIMAIALNGAREHGANIPSPKSTGDRLERVVARYKK